MVNDLFKELDDKLSDLDNRIKRLSQPPAKPVTDAKASGLALGMRLIADIVAGLAVGVGLGFLAEYFFKTGGLLLAVFILLGAAAGFLNLYRTVQQMDKKE